MDFGDEQAPQMSATASSIAAPAKMETKHTRIIASVVRPDLHQLGKGEEEEASSSTPPSMTPSCEAMAVIPDAVRLGTAAGQESPSTSSSSMSPARTRLLFFTKSKTTTVPEDSNTLM